MNNLQEHYNKLIKNFETDVINELINRGFEIIKKYEQYIILYENNALCLRFDHLPLIGIHFFTIQDDKILFMGGDLFKTIDDAEKDIKVSIVEDVKRKFSKEAYTKIKHPNLHRMGMFEIKRYLDLK